MEPRNAVSVSLSLETRPVLSFVDGTSAYQQVFNPAWIAPSPGTGNRSGLLLRSQNCSSRIGQCTHCSGAGEAASVLTFSEKIGTAAFRPVSSASVVFGPHDETDDLGTEDPRVVFDASDGVYWMFYTCYNSGHAQPAQPRVSLCLARASDPTRPGGWTRLGPVGFGAGSKSAALLLGRGGRPHHLLWGAGTIRVAKSNAVAHWPSEGSVLLNQTRWGNPHVEAGPPPMALSTGDFLFVFNSWAWRSEAVGASPVYEPAWAILDKDDPTHVLAEATQPLTQPSAAPWMEGVLVSEHAQILSQ